MGRVYRAVAESQEAGLDAVAPGVTCGAVDEAAREVLRGYGYEEQFLHSTGHGVGLEIHEPPWVRAGNDDVLMPGDAITVEPGVYLPGVGGVRIEDMVLVTESGSTVLTRSSKEPRTP
jgi:Xaa-Pro aminopeptidase/Xaa-Pro dipeptidase